MTSALLKLPQSTLYAKKEERVEQILSELVRLHLAQAAPAERLKLLRTRKHQSLKCFRKHLCGGGVQSLSGDT